ncbi:MAG: CDP-alcohol phosphatidyltransferase family protein [Ruminococcaceae bacterium]|nr:CDP-alcohol phosphatidyltransferase family protein [Oscillospiraceae bacterium]
MQLFNIPWKWSIPNILSLVRLGLVPLFAVLYLQGERWDYWAFGVLALSGLTDCLDGFIARHFNQITEMGKLLDPVADKLTQVMVVICLSTRYRVIIPVAVLCFAKELCQAIGGLLLLRHRNEVRGAKWFGKLYTIAFYTIMASLVLWHDWMAVHAPWLPTALIAVVIGLTVFAFIGYLRIFLRLWRPDRYGQESPVDEKGETI